MNIWPSPSLTLTLTLRLSNPNEGSPRPGSLRPTGAKTARLLVESSRFPDSDVTQLLQKKFPPPSTVRESVTKPSKERSIRV